MSDAKKNVVRGDGGTTQDSQATPESGRIVIVSGKLADQIFGKAVLAAASATGSGAHLRSAGLRYLTAITVHGALGRLSGVESHGEQAHIHHHEISSGALDSLAESGDAMSALKEWADAALFEAGFRGEKRGIEAVSDLVLMEVSRKVYGSIGRSRLLSAREATFCGWPAELYLRLADYTNEAIRTMRLTNDLLRLLAGERFSQPVDSMVECFDMFLLSLSDEELFVIGAAKGSRLPGPQALRFLC